MTVVNSGDSDSDDSNSDSDDLAMIVRKIAMMATLIVVT